LQPAITKIECASLKKQQKCQHRNKKKEKEKRRTHKKQQQQQQQQQQKNRISNCIKLFDFVETGRNIVNRYTLEQAWEITE
jgi:hypothetical protein